MMTNALKHNNTNKDNNNNNDKNNIHYNDENDNQSKDVDKTSIISSKRKSSNMIDFNK